MAIYQKGNNYFIDYYFKGRRKRERIGPDIKLAEIVLKKRQVEIAEGKFLDIKKESKYKLVEILTDFLGYSKNCKRSYKRDLGIQKQIRKFFGNKLLSEITPSLIESYRTKRLDAGTVSKSTINREVAFLKAVFNLAIKNKKATENPCTFVKMFQEPEPIKRFLTNEEIVKLLDACSKHLRPIVICALTTGMRSAEIFNLQWKEVDLDKGTIHVTNTKNGRDRYIPICGLLNRTLKECSQWSDGKSVFCNSDGKKYAHVRTVWLSALAKSGIKDFRFHDLRHTAASYLVMLGIDLTTVKEILGHRSISMTLRYSHLSKSHMMEAVEILGSKMDTIWTPEGKTATEPKSDSLKSSSEK